MLMAMARIFRRELLAFVLLLPGAARAEPSLWQALAGGGLVVLMRHARAPGVGDPAGFRLGDCATQRNLDERGRAEARATGAAFRDRRIRVARVLSSRWCRCLETAELLGLGPVEPFDPLNSFFANRGDGASHVEGIRRFVAGWAGPGNAVMVTHQVNVTGATGLYPASGEMVVLRPRDGGIEALGRMTPGGAG
jgi:hypothetical protein